jgi:hypothetical protein
MPEVSRVLTKAVVATFVELFPTAWVNASNCAVVKLKNNTKGGLSQLMINHSE